jgi:hypothetical protein
MCGDYLDSVERSVLGSEGLKETIQSVGTAQEFCPDGSLHLAPHRQFMTADPHRRAVHRRVACCCLIEEVNTQNTAKLHFVNQNNMFRHRLGHPQDYSQF